MCLSTVLEVFDPPQPEEIVGYKVFVLLEERLVSIWQGKTCFLKESFYPKNRWLNEEPYRDVPSCTRVRVDIGTIACESYPTGFHFFPSLVAAQTFRKSLGTLMYDLHVYKIQARNIVAKGSERGFPCWVAQEIFIEEEMTND